MRKVKRICGIYKITNIVNGKFYIGSSKEIIQRWVDHRYLLNSNNHHSKHLQSSWNKHGEQSFLFEIVEECEKEKLIEREQFYLDNLLKADLFLRKESNYFIENGYNINPIVRGMGVRASTESVDKMLKTKNISVYCVDITGKILGEYLSVGLASKNLDIGKNCIYTSIKNGKTTKNSYVGFIYKKEYKEGFRPRKSEAWMKGTKEVIKNENKNIVYVYDIEGYFVEEIKSQLECSLKYNIHPANLVRSLNEKLRIDRFFNRKRKFIFRREKDDKDLEILRQLNSKI